MRMPFILFLLRKLLPYLLLFLVALFFWQRCKDTILGKSNAPVQVTHNTVLTKIEDLGKMELVRYNFKDVIEYSKEYSRWLPNSKSVLIVAGEAVGCVDMSQIKKQDITFTNDTTLTIQLPDPEICYFKIDHSKSKVFALQNTYFQDAELVDEGYKYAEHNIRKAALDAGILGQTADNAEKILKPMLAGITGKHIILIRKQTTKPPLFPKRD